MVDNRDHVSNKLFAPWVCQTMCLPSGWINLFVCHVSVSNCLHSSMHSTIYFQESSNGFLFSMLVGLSTTSVACRLTVACWSSPSGPCGIPISICMYTSHVSGVGSSSACGIDSSLMILLNSSRKIGIAHLSNFWIEGGEFIFVLTLYPSLFLTKIRSVIQPSVGRTSARLPAGRDSEPEFRRIRSLFVTTYFYAHSYGASTEKLCLTFLCTCAQKVKTNFQHLVKASSEFDIWRRQYQCSDKAITLHFYIQIV